MDPSLTWFCSISGAWRRPDSSGILVYFSLDAHIAKKSYIAGRVTIKKGSLKRSDAMLRLSVGE